MVVTYLIGIAYDLGDADFCLQIRCKNNIFADVVFKYKKVKGERVYV